MESVSGVIWFIIIGGLFYWMMKKGGCCGGGGHKHGGGSSHDEASHDSGSGSIERSKHGNEKDSDTKQGCH